MLAGIDDWFDPDPWMADPWNAEPWGDFEAGERACRFTIVIAGVDTLTLPLVDDSNEIEAYVDWGDGTESVITSWDDPDKVHPYAAAGTYYVVIRGKLSGWQFNNGGDKNLITEISEWGILVLSKGSAFYGCSNLDVTAIDAPRVNGTSVLFRTFRDCLSLTSIGSIFGWNGSNLNGLGNDFIFNCILFSQDLGALNVSLLTAASYMFYNTDSYDHSFAFWDLLSMTAMTSFMQNSTGLSKSNYDATLIGWNNNPNTPNSLSVDFGGSQFSRGSRYISSTTTGVAVNKLIDAGQTFTSNNIEDVIWNTTDGSWARITALDDANTLSLDTDIMDNADDYKLFSSDAAKAKADMILDKSTTIADGGDAS